MTQVQSLLNEMDHTLELLLDNAEKLHQISLTKVNESELTVLQETQESLVNKLVDLDEALEAHSISSIEREKINEKLKRFESLNQQFIENYMGSHGLINFTSHDGKEKPAGGKKTSGSVRKSI